MRSFCMSRLLLTALVLELAAGATHPPTLGGTYSIGPDFPPDPATKPCSSCEKGWKKTLFMPIKGTAYNCDVKNHPSLKPTCSTKKSCGQEWGTMGTRNITVYIPAVIKDGDEVGVMFTQDGEGVGEMLPASVSNTMDNLMGANEIERSLPKFIWVAVSLAGPGRGGNCAGVTAQELQMGKPCPCGDGDGSERFNEYATVSTTYGTFVSKEVLPFVMGHPDIKSKFPNLKVTDDPGGRAAAGCSNGGGAAMRMGFLQPELYGIVIAYSAALTKAQDTGFPLTSLEAYPLGMASMWAGPELIKKEPAKPVRIFHSGNEWDFGTVKSCWLNPDLNKVILIPYLGPMITEYENFLVANNKTEAALVAKGYETRYSYALGACHCQRDALTADFPNSLVWAWAKWKKKQSMNKKDCTPQVDCWTSYCKVPCVKQTLLEEWGEAIGAPWWVVLVVLVVLVVGLLGCIGTLVKVCCMGKKSNDDDESEEEESSENE